LVRGDDSATAMLRALARVERQLDRKRKTMSGLVGTEMFSAASHSLVLSEICDTMEEAAAIDAGARPGLQIWATLQLTQRDDELGLEWTLDAHNALDGTGWLIERDTVMNDWSITEDGAVVGRRDLPDQRIAETDELANALPDLVAELLELPKPWLRWPHGWTGPEADVQMMRRTTGQLTPTAAVRPLMSGEEIEPAAALTIGRYEGDVGVYLFYVDPRGRVVTDTWHKSVEQAVLRAEIEYGELAWVDEES
jgi:hypothetical protein